MSTVNQQGTRVFYAPSGTAVVALAALANPAGTFIELTRIIKADADPAEYEDYDDAPLAALIPDPQIFVKPGKMSFSKDKVTAETTVLRGYSDGTTLKVWVILYKDGSQDYCTGKLKLGKVSAQKGDFKAHVPEEYMIVPTTVVSFLAGI